MRRRKVCSSLLGPRALKASDGRHKPAVNTDAVFHRRQIWWVASASLLELTAILRELVLEMFEALIVERGDISDLPPIFHRTPCFLGPIGDLPVELRSPHVLHVTVLKQHPIRSFSYTTREIASAVKGPVECISALGGEDFLQEWCLTFGTSRMFEDAGTILLEHEKTQKVEVFELVSHGWGFRWVPPSRGTPRYSPLEIATHEILGAQLYRVERLLVGALQGRVTGNPTTEAQSRLAPFIERFRPFARGADLRSTETDYALRRLRSELGAQKQRRLQGGASLRQISSAIEREGKTLTLPARPEEDWIFRVPELAPELELLDHLLVLCRRADRLRHFIDRKRDRTALSRADDPALLLGAEAADALIEFGKVEHGDIMPPLSALTRIAVAFDFNAVALYPSLAPLGLHLAAACALGRRMRGVRVEESAYELWGLRGLRNADHDGACFWELLSERCSLRGLLGPEYENGGKGLPPFLLPREGLHNVPIAVKPG